MANNIESLVHNTAVTVNALSKAYQAALETGGEYEASRAWRKLNAQVNKYNALADLLIEGDQA